MTWASENSFRIGHGLASGLGEAGVEVLDAPFVAHGNVATADGRLASQFLAAWTIARLGSLADAEEAIHHVAPVG